MKVLSVSCYMESTATSPGSHTIARDVDWRGEWRMVTVSLIICNLATRVRWSFSEFKMSHYIDCQVLRSDGDTDAGAEVCWETSLCPRLRQLASPASWRHRGGCHDLVFTPDIIMFCGEGSCNLDIDLHHYSQYTLLIFCTKCEGKFVPVAPTNNVATEHVQCTAAAGLGWWEKRISSRLCQPIRGKL